MTLVPARCDLCDYIFQSRAISVSDSGIQMYGNKTQCPQCGGPASFIEGTFNVRDEGFEVLIAPETTVEILRSIGLLLLESASAGEGPEQAAARVEIVSPSAAATIRKKYGGLSTPAFIALITALATGFVEGAGEAAFHHFFEDKPPQVTIKIDESAVEHNLKLSQEERQRIIDDAIRQMRLSLIHI